MALKLYVRVGDKYKELAAVLPTGGVVQKVPIDQAIKRYLEVCTSQKCAKNQKVEAVLFSKFSHYIKKQGVEFVSDVKTEQLEQYQAYLGKKTKPSSVNRRFCVIKNFFAVCLRWQIVHINPCKDIKKRKVTYNPYKNWSEKDFKRFINLTDGIQKQLFMFLWLTGCRPSEAKNFKWDDIDYRQGRIVLNCGKNAGSNRNFPMTSALSKVLHNIRAETQYVFSFNKKQINNDNLYHYAKKRLKRLGLLHLTVYGLRHSFAERLAKMNVSPFYIQKLMGHTDIKTTMNYVHDDKNNLKEALELIKC